MFGQRLKIGFDPGSIDPESGPGQQEPRGGTQTGCTHQSQNQHQQGLTFLLSIWLPIRWEWYSQIKNIR